MKLHLLCIQFCLPLIALAQTSVVQDSKGETSLALGSSNVIAVNAQETSLSFSYSGHLGGGSRRHFYLGGVAKASSKANVSNILKEGDVKLKGEIGPYFSIDFTDSDLISNLYFSVIPSFNRYDIFDSTRLYDEQVFEKSYTGLKFSLGVNGYVGINEKVLLLLGLSLNRGVGDNTGDLSTVEVSDVGIINNGVGQSRVVQSKTRNVYFLQSYQQRVTVSNVNADFGLQFFSRFSLILSPRISVSEIRKPQFNPALGIYLSKDGAPLEIVAGIQAQTLDWYNTSDSEKSRSNRTLLNFVCGYTF